MLTIQEIQAAAFEKAVFGGYDQKSVDEFLEKITESYAALQKENAALKSKMKVLVDKIEEYRSVESGMRRALVSAQSIAQETIDKAHAESEQLVQQAKLDAEEQIDAYRVQIEAEADKLRAAKEKTAQFLSRVTALYDEETKLLMKMSASDDLQIDARPVRAAEPVKQHTQVEEQSTKRIEIAAPAEPVGQETRPIERKQPVEAPAQAEPVAEEPPARPALRFNVTEVKLASSAEPLPEHRHEDFDFGDLKFGADYNPSDEK